MTDSPVGFAMRIYEFMATAVDVHVWTPEEVVTWATMYLIQGPHGGMRLYREGVRTGTVVGFGFGAFPFVRVPVGIAEYPFDVWYRLPDYWDSRSGDGKARYVHDVGGRFAAYEVPDLLLGTSGRSSETARSLGRTCSMKHEMARFMP